MALKLHQVLAMEKSVKPKCESELTRLYQLAQKGELFSGLSKTYRKKDEDGEDFPTEKKKVSVTVDELVKGIAKAFIASINVEATKNRANQSAKADLVVNGETWAKDVAAETLLNLDKTALPKLREVVSKIPTLDREEEWTKDPNSLIFRCEKTSTHRTKKVNKPLVLYPATDKHPAQTQLVTEDVITGWWDTIRFSGAMPLPEKEKLLEKIDSLIQAVKLAVGQANSVETEMSTLGDLIIGKLFG